jgi:hypothetical protein
MWISYSIRERARICRENGVSIFAARSETIPADGRVYEYLTTD